MYTKAPSVTVWKLMFHFNCFSRKLFATFLFYISFFCFLLNILTNRNKTAKKKLYKSCLFKLTNLVLINMQGNCSEIFIYQLIKFMSNNFDCCSFIVLLFVTEWERDIYGAVLCFHKTNSSHNIKENEGKLLLFSFCCVYFCYHKS